MGNGFYLSNEWSFNYMQKSSKIYVAGHCGLVGGAILRCLKEKGYTNIITRTHSELDLLNQDAVNEFFAAEKPEYVFLAAAHVGGIGANSTYPADFIYQNMVIGFNVVEAARITGVKKLMNLGSTCIYPKMAEQPIKEESLLTGALEPTNDAYALAKICVIKLCTAYNKQHGTNFLSVMPTNLYGLGDNYELQGSHVFPAMIRKFHEAKASGEDVVHLWGDGSPLREFLFAGDLAEAVVYLMENKNASEHLQVILLMSVLEVNVRSRNLPRLLKTLYMQMFVRTVAVAAWTGILQNLMVPRVSSVM